MKFRSVFSVLLLLVAIAVSSCLVASSTHFVYATSGNSLDLGGQQGVGTVVLDLGRVSKSGAFNYTATQPSSYDLVFSNEYDNFSLIVWYNVSWPSGNTYSFMEIPFNETHWITVNLDQGQEVSGNFSISGGQRYNDIHFFIRVASTPTPIPSATPTISPTPTFTATPMPSLTPAQTPTPTPSPAPTLTPNPTSSLNPTLKPSESVSPTQTVKPVPFPSTELTALIVLGVLVIAGVVLFFHSKNQVKTKIKPKPPSAFSFQIDQDFRHISE